MQNFLGSCQDFIDQIRNFPDVYLFISFFVNSFCAFFVSLLTFNVFRMGKYVEDLKLFESSIEEIKPKTKIYFYFYQIIYSLLTALITAAIIQIEFNHIDIAHSIFYATLGPYALKEKISKLLTQNLNEKAIENVDDAVDEIKNDFENKNKEIKNKLLKEIEKQIKN